MNKYCSCGTYSVGRCVNCGEEGCANHSRLVSSRRLCSSCEAAESRFKADERAARKQSHEDLEREMAREVARLKAQLVGSSIEPQILKFTTTMLDSWGRPWHETGSIEATEKESEPNFGQFDSWKRVLIMGNWGPKFRKFAVCSATGWALKVGDGSRARSELWIDGSGMSVWPERPEPDRSSVDHDWDYPSGVPMARVFATEGSQEVGHPGVGYPSILAAFRERLGLHQA